MAKIARFNEFLNEDSKIVPLDDFEYININDPKLMNKIKFDPTIHYKWMDVVMHFNAAKVPKLENEKLRYSAIFGYGDMGADGNPVDFDWVVYGKTPEILMTELKRMVHQYVEANPRKKAKTGAVKESDDHEHEDSWRQLTKEEKVEKLMKKLDSAIKNKKLTDEDAEKIRARMEGEIKKSGPDKIRRELRKRAQAEAEIGSGGEGGDEAGRLDKAKELVKQEVWKGYKQPVGQFWDNVYDIMAGE